MLATRLTCPHCSKQLKLRNAPLPGRRVLCSGCQRSFAVPAESVTAVPSAVPEPSAIASAPATNIPFGAGPLPDWASQLPDKPLPSSILKPALPPAPVRPLTVPPPVLPAEPEGGHNLKVLLGAILAALLLLGCSAALALHLAAKKDAQQAATPGGEPSQASASTSQPPTDAPGPTPAPAPDAPDAGSRPPADRPDEGSRPPADDIRPRLPDRRPPAVDLPPRTEPVALPPAGERPWLTPEAQTEVNKAIERGAAYLKKKQLLNGSWENHNTTAYAALPALTLLECGVPAKDARIQKAAAFVRKHAKTLRTGKETYELSLALLFLDRLGDPQDRKLIRTIALRLVAGQQADGGWGYQLPEMTAAEEDKLEKFLNQTRPKGLERAVQLPDGRRLDPVVIPDNQRPLNQGSQSTGPDSKQGPSVVVPGGGTAPLDGDRPEPTAKKPEDRKKPLTEAEARKAVTSLPPRLREIPAVAAALGKAGKGVAPGKVGRRVGIMFGHTDNSNTQFATLAMWAASRHGLPLERSLDALAKRFRDSQGDDGTWFYIVGRRGNGGPPAMTGAGLLGLAVGHGLHTGAKKVNADQVEKGFRALAEHIGKPFGADKKARIVKGRVGRRVLVRSPINMYFLWTLERVAVIYNARKIADKDWYVWGVELLLDTQNPGQGFWSENGYPGASPTLDTCLALLFLKRANFASDLSKKLEFVIQGKGTLGVSSVDRR